MQIEILVYDGFIELDALGPLEVLQRAAAHGAELRPTLVRIGSGTVTSAYGLQLHVPAPLDSARLPRFLVVPGAGWLREPASAWAGAQRLRISSALLANRHPSTAIAAVGNGALLLTSAGLLRGRRVARRAAVAAVAELASAGAELIEAGVVDDEDLITSSGATAGLDLSLWIVERYTTPSIAHAIERELGYERRATVWRGR